MFCTRLARIAASSLVLAALTALLGCPTGSVVSVPNVTSMDHSSAEATIQSAGLSVGAVTQSPNDSVPKGHVVLQSPAAGVLVQMGTSVNLIVSTGTGQSHLVEVPSVASMAQEAARSAIELAGLHVGTVSYAYSGAVPEGHVVAQNPTAGLSVQEGSSVNLVVAQGQNEPAYCQLTISTSGNGDVVQYPGPGQDGYEVGTLVTLTAIPGDANTVFSHWSGALTGTANPRSILLNEDMIVSAHFALDGVTIPNVVGMTEGAARSAIESAYLCVGRVSQVYSNTIPQGQVVTQDPNAGLYVGRGSSVDLAISLGQDEPAFCQLTVNVSGNGNVVPYPWPGPNGYEVGTVVTLAAIPGDADTVFSNWSGALTGTANPRSILLNEDMVVSAHFALDSVVVPNVVSMPQADAEETVESNHLMVGTVSMEHSESVTEGRVIRQSPAGGVTTHCGDTVDLVISLGSAENDWYAGYDFASVGCIAYWPFDTDTRDYSGNGLDAVGGASAPGRMGGAYRVDNTYMEVAPSPLLDNLNEMTISCWFYPENTHPIGSELIMGRGKDDFWGTQDWYGLVEGGGNELYATFSRNPDGVNGGGLWTGAQYDGAPQNRWYHLTGVFQDGYSVFYLHDSSGNLLACKQHDSGASWTVDVPDAEPLYFGRHNFTQGWSSRIVGRFDEAVIFDRALSAGEVHALASDEDSSGIADFWEYDYGEPWYAGYDFASVGCIAYWPFDTDTRDYSGNGLDAVGGASAPGRMGGAYRVDNTYMEVAPSPLLDNLNEMTISCWFYPENTHPIGSELIMGRGKDDFWGTQDWYGLVEGGGNELYATFSRNPDGVNGGGLWTGAQYDGAPQNRWYHLTGVFQDGYSVFYLHDSSGNLLACKQHDSGVSWTVDVPDAEPLYFGRHNFTQGWSSRIVGRFDEAVIFDRALSAGEVHALASDEDSSGIADFWQVTW